MRFLVLILLTYLSCVLTAAAQDMGAAQNGAPAAGLSKSKDPVEITADDAIEWLRDQHLYRARGKAMVKQGDTTINADIIEAAYDPALGEQNIQTVTATGHVVIVSQKAGAKGPETRTITADKGIYNLTTGQLTLTGNNLRITSPTMDVTAQQMLSYNRTDNKASARGNAVIKTPDRTLKANEIDAWFTADNQLSRAAARGNVLIQTPQDILQADQGDYNVLSQQAVMIGNVKLTRGENHLQGGKAVVNLKTGVSQLFGTANSETAASGGRVRALFFPGSGKQVMPGDTTADLIPLRPAGRMNQKAGDLPPAAASSGLIR